MKIQNLVFALLALGMASQTNAAIIGFETGQLTGDNTTGYSYSEGILNFNGYHQNANECSGNTDAWCFTDDAVAFGSDGEMFDLVSFDVLHSQYDAMTVTGLYNSNELYTATFASGVNSSNTYLFGKWTGIDQVTISFSDFVQDAIPEATLIDNIVIRTAEVPTPATLLLIGAGLIGLYANRRRQKQI